MMGELVKFAPPPPPMTFGELERVAQAIAKSNMFGCKDPNAVLTLCLLAQAEGQHPAVVFRDYSIIQGKPSKTAEAMLRDFIGAGGKVTWNRLDDECADATFSHPSGGTATINWTLARATKAGIGSKDMWKKYPRQMLRSRVVSEGVRTVCPTATSGLFVPEEVRDGESPQIEAAEYVEEAEISDAQRDLIATLASAVGKSLQEICEAYKIESLKELTSAQAEKLIARLRTIKPREERPEAEKEAAQ